MTRLAHDPVSGVRPIVEGGCTTQRNGAPTEFRGQALRLAARARRRFGRQSMLYRIARWFGGSERQRRLTRGFGGPRPRMR
jgi:hypothetical protein